jgi:hypothetical protein
MTLKSIGSFSGEVGLLYSGELALNLSVHFL